jgi:hypothetical protein
MATKKKSQHRKSNNTSQEEFLVLGHMIKYNLYLLAKSVVFAAVSEKTSNPREAVDIANKVMLELDLDLKRHSTELAAEDNVQ